MTAATVLIVEGEKDADRAWAIGVPATTTVGGAEGFDAWAEDYVAQLLWTGAKRVVLCPDNDGPGHKYMTTWARALAKTNVAVHWLTLPDVPEHGDLSDYLDAGHTVEDLRKLLAAAPRWRPAEPGDPAPNGRPPGADDERSGPPYRVIHGRLAHRRFLRAIRGDKPGVAWDDLGNFEARITEELLLDDGSPEPKHQVIVEGRLDTGEALAPIRVPAAKFGTLAWIAEAWGMRPIPTPGQGMREHLRTAIQVVSQAAIRRTVYTHTGWREHGGRWGYLSASGGLGLENVEVELEDRLTVYDLPLEPTHPAGAMRTSLRVWDLGPLAVTVPLWGSMFRAALGEVLPIDYSIWMEGQSGTFKTSTALIALSHFGRFADAQSLPANWNDTANAIERKLYLAKDAPLLIDDFVREADESDGKASRLLRAQANRVSRARLQADMSARPSYTPRGLLLATAEQRPPGLSLTARILVLAFKPGLIDRARLSAMQRQAHRLPHAMAGFCQWVAPQIGQPAWRATIRERFLAARERARQAEGILRVPEVIAQIWVGVSVALDYAEAVGVLQPDERTERDRLAWQALLGAKGSQDLEVEEQRETRRFLDALWALLRARRATLLERDDPGDNYQGKPELVGWQDGEYVLLNPDLAVSIVARFLRDGGRPLQAELLQLGRQLLEDRLLVPGEGGRPRRQMRVGRKPLRVFCLDRARVATFTGEPGWLGTRTPDSPPDWTTEGPLADASSESVETPLSDRTLF